ncbi:glycosyltransferase [Burkholderia cepacia]|uniref:Glycosyltransferase n=1 Tax=Burkholderia cepacia GG4 TaxID=1009846 RepID=A0A9W3K1L3_BURCE|nr:glycosyltransferase [Burkholderia cepacia]AFQ49149.1 glycosyltransferase [Burkholderia cepacia GG4]
MATSTTFDIYRYKEMKAGKRKVLVCGHDQKFWYPLQSHLEATGLFEFKEDYWPGHNDHDPKKTLEMMEWADIVVAEWALGNAVFCAKHKRDGQRLVTRLHLQERNTPYPAEIDYEKMDEVVFVGQHILEECVAKFPMPKEKVRVVGNFLDSKRFQQEKMGGNEFNLGMIGIVPSRKRLDLALDTLRLLLEKDERYTLHVKGASPQSYRWLMARTAEREYYTKIFETINSSDLRHKVVFDPAGDDVHQWFRKIGFLLSPSDFESFHMAVAEGMCSRAIPVVWNWDGAKTIYPLLPLVDSAQAAADNIDFFRQSNTGARLASQGSAFIGETYSADVVRDQWLDVLLPKQSAAQASAVATRQKTVVVVWAIDAWHGFHRREMLEALARNAGDACEFLIVEPGSHYATLLKGNATLESEMLSSLALKPVRESDNVARIRLLTGGFPAGADVHALLKSNDALGEIAERVAAHLYGARSKVVHWIYKPNQRKHLREKATFVYEVYDEYTADFSTGATYPEVARLEPEVLREADHVFFTSQPLADRKKHHAGSWSLVGNGVAYDVFARYRCFDAARSAKRKSIGYLGNLSDFFDWKMMSEVCADMPELDFVFNGQVEKHRLKDVEEHVERLMALPNVFFAGRVSRPVGAAAVARYDVAIIPFVVNDAMHAVEPLKLWEYFAAGKPVISSPMNAVTVKSPLLRVAASKAEWIRAINESLDELEEDVHREARIELAQSRSWSAMTSKHWATLKRIANV